MDMLSPRQRVLAPKVEPNRKSLSSQEPARDKVSEIFKNRKFYLDIKGKYPSSLVTDIERLGGVSFNDHFYSCFLLKSVLG